MTMSDSSIAIFEKPGTLTPLTRMLMSGQNTAEKDGRPGWRERLEIWMHEKGSRYVFLAAFVMVHATIFAYGFLHNFMGCDLTFARSTRCITLSVSSAAALVLKFDVAVIILPECRTLFSVLSQTRLRIFYFDSGVSVHKLVAWSLLILAWIHTLTQWYDFACLAAQKHHGLRGFLLLTFCTGPGWSGHIMLTSLMIMVLFASVGRLRTASFGAFWATHHLLAVFALFGSVHGVFYERLGATLLPSRGSIWCWMCGGSIYLIEMILREIRGRRKTFISSTYISEILFHY